MGSQMLGAWTNRRPLTLERYMPDRLIRVTDQEIFTDQFPDVLN